MADRKKGTSKEGRAQKHLPTHIALSARTEPSMINNQPVVPMNPVSAACKKVLKGMIRKTERNEALMPEIRLILNGVRDSGEECHFMEAWHIRASVIRIWKVMRRKAQLLCQPIPSLYDAARIFTKVERIYRETKHTTYQAAVREYWKRCGKEWVH